MNRVVLKDAYSVMPLDQRRKLAKHMSCEIGALYRYCMVPGSEKIGKERLAKLLEFMSLSDWRELAAKASQKSTKPIVLKIDFPGITTLPDIIMVGNTKYVPAK
jgi:hypothetical protein